jgi:NmrA-like family
MRPRLVASTYRCLFTDNLVQGSFDDLDAVRTAFQGIYGAWVNTDGFTVGDMKEIYLGMKIFEVAKATSTMRHYVWSNLDYFIKVSWSICCRNELTEEFRKGITVLCITVITRMVKVESESG